MVEASRDQRFRAEVGGGSAARPGWSPLQWIAIAFMAAIACVVVSMLYVERWAAQLDDAALSVSENGAPSVIYLAMAREDATRIEHIAQRAQPATLAADRAAITALTVNFDDALRSYQRTPEYPGERDAYAIMARNQVGFFTAVTAVLDHVGGPPDELDAARRRLASSMDALLLSTHDVVMINQSGVVAASVEITRLRHRATMLRNAVDALAFALVLGGALMGLREARRRLAAADDARRRSHVRASELDLFASRVAHDLRDPLSIILTRSDLGAQSTAPGPTRDALERIAHQAHRMGAILDALLAFARAGAQPEPGKRCDVDAVVKEVIAEAQPFAAEAQIEIVVEPASTAVVACDPSVLAIVLSNLVRNAIKYMGDEHASTRRITLRSRPRGASVRIEVEDTGPGIPPGAEARVFEPFVRLVSGPASAGGVGLGLATVKRLVEAHGGHVGVEPRPEGGCRFWITLPLATEEDEDEPPPSRSRAWAPPRVAVAPGSPPAARSIYQVILNE